MASPNLHAYLCVALALWTTLSICRKCEARAYNGGDPEGFFEMTGRDHNKQNTRETQAKSFPKMVLDNGMFYFVLKDIAHELVQILEFDEGLDLSPRHREAIHNKIESVYDRSRDHPALESDLVAYSPMKPDFHEYTPSSVIAAHAQERREKRSYKGPYAEVCESDDTWDVMETSLLRNLTKVKVLPGMMFHMRQCTHKSEDSSCVGIDEGFGFTRCKTTGTWVRAMVCGHAGQCSNFELDRTCNGMCPDNQRDVYHWEFVYTPTCCKCAFQYTF